MGAVSCWRESASRNVRGDAFAKAASALRRFARAGSGVPASRSPRAFMLGYSLLVETYDVEHVRVVECLADTIARSILGHPALFLSISASHVIAVSG